MTVDPTAKAAINANYTKARRDRGERPLTVWVKPETWKSLERLRDIHGSKEAAIEAAVANLSR